MNNGTRFWSTISRHGPMIAMITIGMVSASVVAAFSITPVYRGEGRILVEEGDIPEDLISTTVRGYVEERVELVRQLVFSDRNVMEIIEDNNLYEGGEPPLGSRGKIRKFKDASNVIVEEMRDGTISFIVSFDDESPETARDVSATLIELFTLENVRSRTASASETAEFLGQEAVDLSARIAEFEEAIARYKERHKGGLPEQQGLNVQLLDRAERELEAVNAEIRSLDQRRSLIEADIVRMNNSISFGGEPPAPGSADRLRYLQAEYLRMLSLYSPEHPDLKRVKREIEVLSPGGSGLSKRFIAEQIRLKEVELEDLTTRYSVDHPDVINAQRSLQELKAQYLRAPEDGSRAVAAQNPEMLRLITEEEGLDAELLAQRNRRNELRGRIAEYEARLTNTPQVERELLELTRGYDQLREKYDDVKLKQTQVELAVSVEEEQRAGRYSVISRPETPDSPVVPNRPAIIFLGIIFGFGLGLSIAAILENLDKTIRDQFDIREVWGGPPLVAIPKLRNTADVHRRIAAVSAYTLVMAGMILTATVTVIAAT